MNREMYKKDRQMDDCAAKAEFAKSNHGILSVNGDDGYPYAVPVNYVYIDNRIYVHSAKYGYKIDALSANKKVCFTSILDTTVLPSKFTAAYTSVVATGIANFVENDDEKRKVLEQFVFNMAPANIENGMKAIKAWWEKTLIIRIDVEQLTGKSYQPTKRL